ncbi:hypothetical protein [Desulfoplanes formicivorans]|uniref:Uncharacterized protein n=1 Tax=Desulfoplanes formicivorans TaxID=1592317 RepID=A0A194AGD7_9BACT|nr:hypothetical protein [Desulfoplanes formicivorans]GAU08146.1 hypothetical protein DPF_0849 [Desulfoplanes formicivorans]
MTLSKISSLPVAPTRQDMDSFDQRADAFLTALVTMQEELDAWVDEFNAEGSTYNDKFTNRDSRLGSLEEEISTARGGSDDLADRLDAMSDRISNLIVMQQEISLGNIRVSRSRRPTPDDDGYLVGTYWVYPGEDDFWMCVRAEVSQYARWRRSNGDLVRRLDAPSVSGDASIDTFGELTLSLNGIDGEATEIRWYATGSPTVVSGAMAGTLNNTITLSWDTAGAYEVRAKVIGDGDLLYDSLYSDALHVVCGPSIYCGCGIYCGDGSYPGMMLE